MLVRIERLGEPEARLPVVPRERIGPRPGGAQPGAGLGGLWSTLFRLEQLDELPPEPRSTTPGLGAFDVLFRVEKLPSEAVESPRKAFSLLKWLFVPERLGNDMDAGDRPSRG